MAERSVGVEFQLLGRLAVLDDAGREIPLRPGRQRSLLARLVLRADQLVPSDVLVEELWGDGAPPTALKMLRNQVSGLRRVLGSEERLETRAGGYRLRLAEGERDIDQFEQFLALGRERLRSDPAVGRGGFPSGVGALAGPTVGRSGLTSLLCTARDCEAEERSALALRGVLRPRSLRVGRHADLVSELESAVTEHPLR